MFYTEDIVEFLSSCLQSSLHIREEAVQTGFCSSLSYLVSKLLLQQEEEEDTFVQNT